MPPFAWVESEWRVRLTARRDAARLEARRGGARPRCATRSSPTCSATPGRRCGRSRTGWSTRRHGRRARPRPPARWSGRSQAEGLVEVEEVLGGRARGVQDACAWRRSPRRACGPRRVRSGAKRAAAIGPKQRDALRGAGRACRRASRWPHLRERGVGADVVQRLAARGLVTIRSEQVDRDPFDAGARRRRRRRTRAATSRGADRRAGARRSTAC